MNVPCMVRSALKKRNPENVKGCLARLKFMAAVSVAAPLTAKDKTRFFTCKQLSRDQGSTVSSAARELHLAVT